MDTEQKLNILASASRFDLACACKGREEPGRVRGGDGLWIYPAALPSGQKVMLLKTLQTNACENDCTYCPFNQNRDIPRCTLTPEELAKTFLALRQADRVTGLFLSSGVSGGPDRTMANLLATADLLRRRHRFKGYIHLKVIPGASDNAIEQAVRLGTRISVNIEAPNAERLARLSKRKNFHQDIIETMRKINFFREKLQKPHCTQTTQFVVGAAEESDREIVLATHRLYEAMKMQRVYFSAYQNIQQTGGDCDLFGDRIPDPMANRKTFVREHRLYQVDFLFRKYGFEFDEIPFAKGGNLSLEKDPKQIWADQHPEFFPVNINRASRFQLLRIPGIGPTAAERILSVRRDQKIKSMEEINNLVASRHLTDREFIAF